MFRLRNSQAFELLIIAAGVLTLHPVIPAQAITSVPSPPQNCSKRDLEIHFGFFESPKNYFNFDVEGLNITDHACTFEYSLFDPRFSGASRQFKCQDCAKREREGYRNDATVTSSPVVGPGEIVRRQYRWRTTPESSSISCIKPPGMDSEYSSTWTLATPSLMRDVCSDISAVGTDVLAPRDASWRENLWTNERSETMILTSARSAYYIDEYFPLTISRKYVPPSGTGSSPCPPVFLWHRSADGTVRVEEHAESSSEGCQTLDLNFRPNKVFFSSEWNSDEAKRLSNYGDQQLQAFQEVDREGDSHVHFMASEILHVQIDGSESTNLRNWTRLKGLAADILLDRNTYKVGDDIPLHLAIANFDATAPIYSWDPVWDPCISVQIEVLDSAGNRLTDLGRRGFPSCSGHGFGPKLFEKGRIASLEWSLKEMGWLPKSPGDYTVAMNWRTSTGSVDEKSNGWKAELSPYATVRATAVIHIIPAESQSPAR